MSQIALDKTTKELQAKAIVAMLWKGQVVEAISYLKTYITAKNETKKIELN